MVAAELVLEGLEALDAGVEQAAAGCCAVWSVRAVWSVWWWVYHDCWCCWREAGGTIVEEPAGGTAAEALLLEGLLLHAVFGTWLAGASARTRPGWVRAAGLAQ